MQIGEPTLNLFLETHDAGGDIVRCKAIQTRKQPIIGRLFLPLQHRKMVCVKKNGHEMLSLEFAFSDESAKPNDFGEDRILSKTSSDLPIPRLPRFLAERSFQLLQVFFDLA